MSHRRHRHHRLFLPVLLLLALGQSLLTWHQVQDALDESGAQCELCLLAQGNAGGAMPPPLPTLAPRISSITLHLPALSRPRQRQPWLRPAGRGPPPPSFT